MTQNARKIVSAMQRRSPLKFVLLLLALSVPFWLIGELSGLELSPGLPVSGLAAFCPAIAALLPVYRESKLSGVKELLKRSFDYERIESKVWYVPIILLMPAVMVLAYWLMRWAGRPVPTPDISILAALALLLAFFVGGLGEELGWSGYAIDPMQERWGALGASILLGLIWAAWHIVPLAQVHRAPLWIAWWSLGTVGLRVLTVWLYNNTGKSVFAATLFHAMGNLTWQLFPIHGSHYDPAFVAPIVAAAAAIVTLLWGPRTLAGYRNA